MSKDAYFVYIISPFPICCVDNPHLRNCEGVTLYMRNPGHDRTLNSKLANPELLDFNLSKKSVTISLRGIVQDIIMRDEVAETSKNL